MLTEELRRLEHRIVEELWNEGKLEVIPEIYAPNFVFHGTDGQDIEGTNGFRQYASTFLTAFPDHHMVVDDVVADGDKMAARVTSTGTHTGNLGNIPPTGKRIKVSGIVIVRFKDGMAVEEWEAFNQLALLQQLGLAPGP